MRIHSSQLLGLLFFTCLSFYLPEPAVTFISDDHQKYESAEICSGCHEQIYKTWKEGYHAKSWDNLVYHAARAGYMKATAHEGNLLCDGCHSPIAFITGDSHFLNPVSTEGVTCDVCHTMTSDEVSGFAGFLPRGGKEKAGPTGDCPSRLHPCRKEVRLLKPEFCAVCHYYVNPSGVPVYTEYTEWRSSRFSTEGKSCIDCHAEGDVSGGKGIHRLIPLEGTGGLLQQALSLGVDIREAGESESILMVRVKNSGAGHAVPGGPPIRSIRLEVKCFDAEGNEVFVDTSAVISRVMEGPISPDTGLALPWLGWREVSDDRIFPGESKVYSFRTGRDDVVRAAVRLLYYRFSMTVEEDFFGEANPPIMASATVKAK